MVLPKTVAEVGSLPVGSVRMTSSLAVSMTETESSHLFMTKIIVSLTVNDVGVFPTGMVAKTVFFSTSMTVTLFQSVLLM